MGHPVVMGRKTFDSLPGALEGRRNIVVSRSLDEKTEGVDVIRSLNQLEQLGLSGTVFVIGGAQIYEAMLPACESIYLTFVFEEYEGDTWFPEFEEAFELDRVLDSHERYERRLYRRR